MKEINNLTCPFCGKLADKKSIENLNIKKITPLMLKMLRVQGFEIKQQKDDKKRNTKEM